MSGNITIFIRGGTYSLSEPFVLDGRDSGNNGHSVIYRAYPGEFPVLSGGRVIQGWEIYDSIRGIYRAQVGPLETRQLYVNGVRATRARGPAFPLGWSKTSTGFLAPDDSLSNWKNIQDVEIVCLNRWKTYRCGIASVSGQVVEMKQPGWGNCQVDVPVTMDTITWIENAFELLDEEGEWYLDRSEGALYYKPRAEEDMSTAVITCPVLESLIVATGAVDEPLHDLTFSGINFSYNTWLEPNRATGYASMQAGVVFIGNWVLERTPAAVSFNFARSIKFERNQFMHLGSAGLSFGGGCQDNLIVGNAFWDISGGAIQVGTIDDQRELDTARQTSGNILRNNYITQTGQEYFDSVGIFEGYVSNSTIDHNEIINLPYTGISVGWGWGADSYACKNSITNNSIGNTMLVLQDGGAIYTLSPQPGSTVSGNYINSTERGLYHDEGTAYYTDRNNVLQSCRLYWLILWTTSIHDNDIEYCWYNTDNAWAGGTNNVVINNTLVANVDWPDQARVVIEAAGLESAYCDIKQIGK